MVNVFLPSADLLRCPSFLDNQRLLKQIVEGFQILHALDIRTHAQPDADRPSPRLTAATPSGWLHAPAVRMWRGYEPALMLYLNEAIRVLREERRTTAGTPFNLQSPMFTPFSESQIGAAAPDRVPVPPFLQLASVTALHRGNLLRKALDRKRKMGRSDHFDWYRQFGWTDPPANGYLWVFSDLDEGQRYRLIENDATSGKSVSYVCSLDADGNIVQKQPLQNVRRSEQPSDRTKPLQRRVRRRIAL